MGDNYTSTTTRTEGDFSSLSDTSDSLGRCYISSQFPTHQIINENDTDIYSANDFLVRNSDLSDCYLVEVKNRTKFYETVMLEVSKYDSLIARALEYKKKGVTIKDIFYYNIITTGTTSVCYCYSFKLLRAMLKAQEYSITSTATPSFTQAHTNSIEVTTTYCPRHTANDGDNGYKSKEVYLLPVSMGEIIK